ncbi:MAG: rhodanese-like domain-containing protein [Ilumatobacter sp.]|nr:rhodanese-like domain-containing protein [Ilumatobacter sp.]
MVTPISVTELVALLAEQPVLLVEALSADFHATGHLPDAVSVPLSSTDSEVASWLSEHDGTVVVYGSRDGGEAIELADRMILLSGVERDVRVLEGGKEAWVESGHSLTVADD